MKKIFFIIPLVALISCGESESIDTTSPQTNYKQLGDSITMISMQTLLANVSREMKNGGPTNAVDFCNIHASELTDSLSSALNATIGRISAQNRNRENQASEDETKLLNEMFGNGQKDTLISNGDQAVYYKNILIGMPTCLKCHGSETEISEATSKIINMKYPDDKATGYKLGDLRGAWKVVFNIAD